MSATTAEPVRTSTSTVLIVDDHPVLRLGLAALIESEPELAVSGEAATVNQALALIGKRQPNLVIVDLTLEGSDGLDLVKAMKVKHPNIPALVLSMHDEAVYAERALKAGARGYVTKQQLDETLLVAIYRILAGETYMSDALEARLAQKFVGGRTLATDSPLDALSDRELQVFGLIGRGQTTRKIATNLNLSIKTIESHLEHIKQKLDLESAAALAQRATQWVETGHTG